MKLLQWTQRVLTISAVAMLGYCGFVWIDGQIFQNREGRRLEHLLLSPGVPPIPAVGGLIGRIMVPRLGVSVIVAEGVDTLTLRRAAGHIPGTALPGHPGNIGISGHRDTFFRPLRNIRKNDLITFTTLLGEYRYRVVSTKVVRPYNVAVLDPGEIEVLTLVTCYPFYFVGSAPDRFIIRAERVI